MAPHATQRYGHVRCMRSMVTMGKRANKKASTAAAPPAWRDDLAAVEDELVTAVGMEKRDVALITGCVEKLTASSAVVPKEAIHASWRLLWVPTAAALDRIGTGLHALPGTSFEDFFVTLGKSKEARCEVRAGTSLHARRRGVTPFLHTPRRTKYYESLARFPTSATSSTAPTAMNPHGFASCTRPWSTAWVRR